VIVAVPLVTAVTSPADETVATEASDDDHVTVAPDITDPDASFTVALNVTVSPRDAKLFVLGETVTLVGTWPIVTEAVPVAEPEVPVIVVLPSATEVTSPTDETVATAASEDDQVTVAPEITEPAASFTVVIKLAVSAIDEKVSEVGETSRVAATCETVTVAAALADPEVAVIVAVPLVIAVTRPTFETVAIDASEEDHVTGASSTTTPPMVTVAESCEVWESDEKLMLELDSSINS